MGTSNDETLGEALSEVNVHISRALEVLEDVPDEAFTQEEDRFRLVELIARAGGIVASEESGETRRLAERGKHDALTLGPCTMPVYSKREEE